jgi:carboxyl-terminal processing protease
MNKQTLAVLVCALGMVTWARADLATVDTIVGGVTNAVGVLDRYGLPVDAAAAQRTVVEAIIRVADPSARVLSRASYDHMMDERNGLDFISGLRISMTNGQPRVIDVMADSPAQAAGLRPGDLITGINGEDILRSDIATCSRLLRGHTAETVRVRFTRALDPTNTAEIALALMKVPAVEVAEELPNQLAYLRLNGLFAGTGKDVVTIVRGWAETGRFGVVLDLRGAKGTDLDSVVEIASLLAESEARLFAFKTVAGEETDVKRAHVGSPVNMPVMVLIDAGTAGAPEVLAAVLTDSVRGAMVVGTESFGDPMIREPVELPTGEILYLATRRLVTSGDAAYGERGGVKPDIAIDPGRRALSDYEPELAASERRALLDKELADRALRDRLRGDESLQRAVDVLLGLKALNLRGVSPTPAD